MLQRVIADLLIPFPLQKLADDPLGQWEQLFGVLNRIDQLLGARENAFRW
jgi:hypothetical protein